MVIIELLLMRRMYENKRLNGLSAALAFIAGIGFLAALRTQAGVADEQFLKSMIPHHASAILMCQQAAIRQAEVLDLCKRIVSSQQSEIAEMKRLLEASSK